ncbi:MAG: sugar ABC transporter permease [Clostridiales bacterium]|nr:sugar ABC transporter permease [Clostridiales bacterium]
MNKGNTVARRKIGSNTNFKKTLKRALSDWQLYVLILPALVYLIIFAYAPMYGIQIAFKDYRAKDGIWGSEWVGFKHFARFLSYPAFWKIIKNTLSISLYSLATFPCAVILSLLINELDNAKFKKTVQMITYAPHFISTVVLCGMIKLFFNRGTGIINNVIEILGGTRIDFLAKPEYFNDIYVWSGVWQGVGWGTIIYLAVLSNVSPELVEAARIDGASRFQVIRHVNIPAILPTIIIMLILSCGSVLSVGFEKVYLLQNNLNSDASQVISTYVYEIGLVGGQFSYSSAISLFNTIINVLFILTVNTIARRVSDVSLW